MNFRGVSYNPARTNGHHGHPPEAETVTASRETAFLGAPKKGGERWSQVGLLSTKIGEGYVTYVYILYIISILYIHTFIYIYIFDFYYIQSNSF